MSNGRRTAKSVVYKAAEVLESTGANDSNATANNPPSARTKTDRGASLGNLTAIHAAIAAAPTKSAVVKMKLTSRACAASSSDALNGGVNLTATCGWHSNEGSVPRVPFEHRS